MFRLGGIFVIFLEKVKENDVLKLYQMQKVIFEKLYCKYQDEQSPFNETKASIREKINRADNFFCFIKNKDKTIGYARIVFNIDRTKAKIGPIGILPKYEENGYGTEAMFLIEKEFPIVREWYLDTILQETKLTHFYSKLGYKETGQIMTIQEGMEIIFFMKKIKGF